MSCPTFRIYSIHCAPATETLPKSGCDPTISPYDSRRTICYSRILARYDSATIQQGAQKTSSHLLVVCVGDVSLSRGVFDTNAPAGAARRGGVPQLVPLFILFISYLLPPREQFVRGIPGPPLHVDPVSAFLRDCARDSPPSHSLMRVSEKCFALCRGTCRFKNNCFPRLCVN